MIELKVGDTIVFSKFAFTNPGGGTGMSNWKYDEIFKGYAAGRITQMWHDYEIGWVFIVEAISPDLIEYMERNAHPVDRRISVSQFDLIPERLL